MDINWDWVMHQLSQVNTSQQLTTSVERLMQVLETMNLSQEQLDEVLTKFHELALGHSIIPAKPHERWVPVFPGSYGVGDTVRVKPTAYTGKLAVHNGLRGRVVITRGDRAVVAYDSEPRLPDEYYHFLTDLERLL